MNKKKYNFLLRDYRWKKKAKYIRSRDGNMCKECKTKKSKLHVHHLYYIDGKDPWDYPDEAYVTLCWRCHKKAHGESIDVISENNQKKRKVKPKTKSAKSKTPKEKTKKKTKTPKKRIIQVKKSED